MPRPSSLNIGPCPNDEKPKPCQLGADGYTIEARTEIRRYIEQLKRIHGNPPMGARYKITTNPHDFGTYYDLDIEFDEDNEAAREYAYKVEAACPEHWDEESKK